jgi:hypothetical protein
MVMWFPPLMSVPQFHQKCVGSYSRVIIRFVWFQSGLNQVYCYNYFHFYHYFKNATVSFNICIC